MRHAKGYPERAYVAVERLVHVCLLSDTVRQVVQNDCVTVRAQPNWDPETKPSATKTARHTDISKLTATAAGHIQCK